MEKEKAELKAKIKTLRFRVKKPDEILQKDDRVALERHRASLESVVTAVTTLKESIEDTKFIYIKYDVPNQLLVEKTSCSGGRVVVDVVMPGPGCSKSG